MMMYVNGIYQSTLLSGLSVVVHGFSSRSLGDARKPAEGAAFVSRVTGKETRMIGMSQVHGADVVVANSNSPRVIQDTDGVVTTVPGIVLAVHVADCVPILLVDPIAKVAAAVHAGWRGTLGHIAHHGIVKMIEVGATNDNIYAFIGPHIGRCCYTVGSDRAVLFRNMFGADDRNIMEFANAWHLDLGHINRQELIDVGIHEDHIDAPVVCTSCQVDKFFSYRKDTKETFGEIIGIVGFVS